MALCGLSTYISMTNNKQTFTQYIIITGDIKAIILTNIRRSSIQKNGF